MTIELGPLHTRRAVLASGLILAGGAVAATLLPTGPAARPDMSPPAMATLTPAPPSQTVTAPSGLPRPLLQQAKAALAAHGRRIAHHDRIGVVDFSAPSREPRLHLIDLESGKARHFLVAHGSGSDPDHSGWLKRFSNRDGSNASCEGAFVTDDYYIGKHGRSQRLVGLDPSNDNALARAIVVHGAWYVSPDMVAEHGVIGRSQGCFAVADSELDDVFRHLGTGRMIYAAKV